MTTFFSFLILKRPSKFFFFDKEYERRRWRRRRWSNQPTESVRPIANTSDSEDPTLNDMTQKIRDHENWSFANVDHLFGIKDIRNWISDLTLLVRDSNGDDYSIYFVDIQNHILEIAEDRSCLSELSELESDLYSDRNKGSKRDDPSYDSDQYMYDTLESSEDSCDDHINHIKRFANRYLSYPISPLGIDNAIGSGIFRYIDGSIDVEALLSCEGDLDEEDKNESVYAPFKDLWVLCENCERLNYKKVFRSNLNICELCGHPGKMSSSEKIELLIDPGTWDPMDEDMLATEEDPNKWDSGAVGADFQPKVDKASDLLQSSMDKYEACVESSADIQSCETEFKASFQLALDPLAFLDDDDLQEEGDPISRTNEDEWTDTDEYPSEDEWTDTDEYPSEDEWTDTDEYPSEDEWTDEDEWTGEYGKDDSESDDDDLFRHSWVECIENGFPIINGFPTILDPEEEPLELPAPCIPDPEEEPLELPAPCIPDPVPPEIPFTPEVPPEIPLPPPIPDPGEVPSGEGDSGEGDSGEGDSEIQSPRGELTDNIESSFDFDEETYPERLDSYKLDTGLNEAVQTGTGQLNGIPIAIGVMEFEFMGGSMGSAVGEKITRLVEYATKKFLPLILVCASGGARMQEGSLSLMQMAKISSALYEYRKNQNSFYVSILTSPTTGGVTASFGMLGDIIIAEPKAYIAFAGKRVIEETLKITLPEGSQETEYLFEKGLFDLVVERGDLKSVLSELLEFHDFFPMTQN